MNVRHLYEKPNTCWIEEQRALITFLLADSETWGFPFHTLEAARLTKQVLTLQWPSAMVEIKGPRAGELLTLISKHQASEIKVDGKGITAIEVHIPQENQ